MNHAQWFLLLTDTNMMFIMNHALNLDGLEKIKRNCIRRHLGSSSHLCQLLALKVVPGWAGRASFVQTE